jgi:hypothetical protein
MWTVLDTRSAKAKAYWICVVEDAPASCSVVRLPPRNPTTMMPTGRPMTLAEGDLRRMEKYAEDLVRRLNAQSCVAMEVAIHAHL